MYKTSPVQVSLTPQEADLLEEPMIVKMALQPQGSMDVTVKIDDDEYQKHFEKLPAVFPTDKGTLAFFLTLTRYYLLKEHRKKLQLRKRLHAI